MITLYQQHFLPVKVENIYNSNIIFKKKHFIFFTFSTSNKELPNNREKKNEPRSTGSTVAGSKNDLFFMKISSENGGHSVLLLLIM